MKKTIGGLAVLLEGSQKNRPIIFTRFSIWPYDVACVQIAALSDTYYCVAYDIRGLGGSSVGDGQFTMESFVDDLAMMVEELKEGEKPIVCAFSMGGYIALRALERMEDKFSAVILMRHSFPCGWQSRQKWTLRCLQAHQRAGLPTFSKNFIKHCYTDAYKSTKRLLINASQSLWRLIPSALKGVCLLCWHVMIPLSIFLPSKFQRSFSVVNTTPSHLLLVWKRWQKIDGAEFVLIKKAAHMSVVENPTDCNET